MIKLLNIENKSYFSDISSRTVCMAEIKIPASNSTVYSDVSGLLGIYYQSIR